jgi:TPP-dependent pyruvate/acetoin dehydrogenase alpha subunit
MSTSPEEAAVLRRHLATMWRIRVFEDEVARLHGEGELVGSVHLCNGQEGIYVGACAALNLEVDGVFPTYRGHGWTISAGAPLARVFGELLGRENGLNGGRGGSAYHSAPEYGMYGENSIVGAGAPIAVGAALAGVFDGSNRVALAAFGEGALNQGAVHEAMNFAAAKSLPVIFLVENNRYSELTPTEDVVKVASFYRRGSAYGIPGVRIDGNDVLAVQATIAEAARRARGGAGPVLVEATTERLVGHYIGDAQVYRPAGELEAAWAKEPIVRAAERLAAAGVPQPELESIEQAARADVSRALSEALSWPPADPASVLEHLYAEAE